MSYELDRCRCQALTTKKKRCTLIGYYSDGGKVYCERHVQIARRDRANKAPVKGKK